MRDAVTVSDKQHLVEGLHCVGAVHCTYIVTLSLQTLDLSVMITTSHTFAL